MKKGDLLMTFDINAIKKSGYKVTTPIIICNSDDFKKINTAAEDAVNAGDEIIKIVK